MTEVEVWLLKVPTPVSVQVTGEADVRVMDLPTATAGLAGVMAGPACGRARFGFFVSGFLSRCVLADAAAEVADESFDRKRTTSRQDNALMPIRPGIANAGGI